jgi:hypothetical protein
MNKKTYTFLAFALCLLTFAFISGCGKYATQYSAPVIIERYPVAGTGGVGTTETMWIKFSKSMDTSGLTSIDSLATKIKYVSDMTATVTFYPDATPEVIWSDDDTIMTFINLFFIANTGSRIHLQASLEAFQDRNGLYLAENADLWNFTLAGLYVVSRSPTTETTVPNSPMTLVATFDNSVSTGTFLAGIGTSHTAGAPIPYPPSITWSNSNKTVSIGNITWEASPGKVIDITYEATDIYGNVTRNGQLFKFNLQ